jgi:hypothetical protein
MLRKTDKFLKRRVKVWERGFRTDETVTEIVRRETWWLLFIIPLLSIDTVVEKPR